MGLGALDALLAGSSPRRATYFSLSRQRKVGKRKATPLAVSLRFAAGNLRCSGAGRRCGTRCALARFAQTTAASQNTKRGMLRCRARPTPCASRHGQRGSEVHTGHRCARPSVGLRRCFARRAFLLPLPQAGRVGVRANASFDPETPLAHRRPPQTAAKHATPMHPWPGFLRPSGASPLRGEGVQRLRGGHFSLSDFWNDFCRLNMPLR